MPRSTSLAVTLAPLMAAPVSSTTVPVMLAVFSCATADCTGAPKKKVRNRQSAIAVRAQRCLRCPILLAAKRVLEWEEDFERNLAVILVRDLRSVALALTACC